MCFRTYRTFKICTDKNVNKRTISAIIAHVFGESYQLYMWGEVVMSALNYYAVVSFAYISRLCYDVNVRLSVYDGSELAHYS